MYNASDPSHLQEMVRLRQHTGPVYSLAWSAHGQHLASGGHDCTIRLWGWSNSARTWRVHTQFPVDGHQGHRGGINSLDWWRGDDGSTHLISGSQDGTVKVWNVEDKLELPTRLRCHNGSVNSLSCWRGTDFFASAADDGFIFIHTLAPPRTSRVLEGHTAAIKRIDFSADGSILASKAYDDSVRLWSTATWEQVQLIDEPGAHTADPQHNTDWHAGMAFHPRTRHLATLDCCDKAIRIWIPDSTSHGRPSDNQNVTTGYISAKVVLIGRSDVGKTSLLTRLLERRYISHNQRATTHGMHVVRMDANDFHHNMAPRNGAVLSLAFWDLGGQDHYQLVHQLFLHDTTLALILVDPTRGSEALDDALRWSQALERHMPNPAAKLLVGSRQDEESPLVDRRRIKEFVEANKFAGYLEVSARNGRNIEEL
ncbi:MAG: GTP-binding protein, partial [Dechloromonas sp.]|nr:GTP-binding protein [Dechloromonas sp.]